MMRCPFCHGDEDRVVDSRSTSGGEVIRRRRECELCSRRFTTYERVETMPLRVIKKDGTRVRFERQKILDGMLKACEKRPVSAEALEKTVGEIEAEIYRRFEREVPSEAIGELVVERLRELDEVAYVRFASVYRAFKDVAEFMDEVKPMLKPQARRGGKQ